MKYTVHLSPAAVRYFKKIRDKELSLAFRTALLTLAESPHLGSPKRGDLSGVYGYDVWHKGTNYEIAYKVYESGDRQLVVILAGTRGNFYEQLKRHVRHK